MLELRSSAIKGNQKATLFGSGSAVGSAQLRMRLIDHKGGFKKELVGSLKKHCNKMESEMCIAQSGVPEPRTCRQHQIGGEKSIRTNCSVLQGPGTTRQQKQPFAQPDRFFPASSLVSDEYLLCYMALCDSIWSEKTSGRVKL